MELLVCVGSACHLRGAHEVLQECEEIIHRLGLEDQILLKAGFCQGRCTEGVNLVFEGESISKVRPGGIQAVFDAVILPRIKRGGQDGTHHSFGSKL